MPEGDMTDLEAYKALAIPLLAALKTEGTAEAFNALADFIETETDVDETVFLLQTVCATIVPALKCLAMVLLAISFASLWC